jgi:hypothetical protein
MSNLEIDLQHASRLFSNPFPSFYGKRNQLNGLFIVILAKAFYTRTLISMPSHNHSVTNEAPEAFENGMKLVAQEKK